MNNGIGLMNIDTTTGKPSGIPADQPKTSS